jgi:hypothetical protein
MQNFEKKEVIVRIEEQHLGIMNEGGDFQSLKDYVWFHLSSPNATWRVFFYEIDQENN